MSDKQKTLPSHEIFVARNNKLYKAGALWTTEKGNLIGETALGRIVLVPRKDKAHEENAADDSYEYPDAEIGA